MMKKNEKLQDLTPLQWESLCDRCARCCYEKIDFNGRIFYTKKPCDQLDLKTGLCKVYADRDQVRSDCQRLTPALVSSGVLPADCPYVQYADKHRDPALEDDK